ncbi:MAG TPA: alpha/beta hydrolase-fold protein [Mucilaginibacter sp.]|jgi:predicted alpha/beta superfamily hydrolase
MNIKKTLNLFLQVTFLCSISAVAHAQDLPGKRDSLQSVILNEKRVIQVVMPRKYKPESKDKYDVLYVLDGDWNTKTMTDVQRFIEDESYMPPTIIVGVLNVDRDRDLTPTHVNDNKTSGGADKFLSFLKNELIPYVNKTYPSNGDNTIFGHSFGGLFVTYALLNEPQVFKSYIAADPSFWWDKNWMNKVATDKLPGLANLNKTLYISGREGQPYTGMGIVSMDSVFKSKAPAGFIWKDQAYPNETHGSVRLKSMYDGLKFTYAGYSRKAPEFHPMAGTVLKDKPFKIWYFDDVSKMHYTTDGSEPTVTSQKMEAQITLPGPAVFKLKRFSNRERYDSTATGNLKEGAAWPAKAKIKNVKPGGFHYAYYEGQWNKLPDFKTLKPVQSGVTDKSFDINKLPSQNNFGLVIDGYIEVKEDGYYVFGLASDDGSKFYLNNQLLADDDGLHNSDNIKSYIVPLQKGFYPLRLEYFQKDGGRDLKLMYITPSMTRPQPITIPLELQYSKK